MAAPPIAPQASGCVKRVATMSPRSSFAGIATASKIMALDNGASSRGHASPVRGSHSVRGDVGMEAQSSIVATATATTSGGRGSEESMMRVHEGYEGGHNSGVAVRQGHIRNGIGSTAFSFCRGDDGEVGLDGLSSQDRGGQNASTMSEVLQLSQPSSNVCGAHRSGGGECGVSVDSSSVSNRSSNSNGNKVADGEVRDSLLPASITGGGGIQRRNDESSSNRSNNRARVTDIVSRPNASVAFPPHESSNADSDLGDEGYLELEGLNYSTYNLDFGGEDEEEEEVEVYGVDNFHSFIRPDQMLTGNEIILSAACSDSSEGGGGAFHFVGGF
eukprot:GHVU01190822.1.p1 GENE.GHVU01190822.1~~GHVU01190822.1.p1  ORF type:complete len:331 (-),score=30.92 GHVU01190822.1:49-1041(-)